MFDIEKIKDKVSCIDFCRTSLGMQITQPGKRCTSFRPGAKNATSLLVNERNWFDFGSDMGGDVIDLCAESMFSGNKGEAIRFLANIAGVEDDRVPMGDLNVLNHQAAYYHQELTSDHRQYLNRRGITDKTIDDLLIGYAQNDGQWIDRIMFPYWKGGRVTYFIGRALNDGGTTAKYIKMKSGVMTEHTVWGMDTLRRQGPVIIAEGIFDALSVYQEGYAVISPITGRFSRQQMKDVISLTHDRDIVVCLDYDPESQTGQRATMKIAEDLFMARRKVSVVMLPGTNVKVDLNELYAAGANIKTILKGGQDFAKVRVEAIEASDKEGLSTFLHQVSRFYSAPDVAEICGYAADLQRWDAKWLRTLEQQLRRPPSDHQIVKDICAAYNLMFHEQLGWYEYHATRGVWQDRWETEIKSYIGATLGHHRTGSRVNSVYTTLKTECVNRQEINSHHDLLNVRNGMLNVLTGELKPHAPTYYSTIQLAYSYEPDMYCPNWLQFLEDVTDCDEQRMLLIQEMFGYCLLPEAKLQTAFFLLGKGANGKSKLLEVLTHMLGSENVSHVEIGSLVEPFQRIRLMKSLANICSETKSNIKEAEQMFKQIVGGDADISGCYKNKDFIDFRPRCKMISAANQHIESQDLSDGFTRRMRFINFPVKFVAEPRAKHERQRDLHILDKILPEIPGILNWALIGAKALSDKKEFTICKDQEQMMADFISISSPLLGFCEHLIGTVPTLFTNTHEYSEIYKRYAMWARESGTGQYSSRKFWSELRNYMPYMKTRSNGKNYCSFIKSDVDTMLQDAVADQPLYVQDTTLDAWEQL